MVKELFGDMILLELDKAGWEAEQKKSPIVLPGAVQERQEGVDKTRIPFHFFKVTQLGPEVSKFIQIGDRLIPRPPTPNTPPMSMIVVWNKGTKEAAFITSEKSVAGVE
jgi:hypothetical protein